MPSGTFPIVGIRHVGEDPTYGSGAIIIGDPGSLPQKRSTWVHGGRDDWNFEPHGCTRLADDVIDIIKVIEKLNPGRGFVDIHRDPAVVPRTLLWMW